MKQSQKQKLRCYAGDLSGLFGMRNVIINDGRGKGMQAIELNNGCGLYMMLLADRCLDIPYLSYKGINLGLVTKVGLINPAFYVEDGIKGFLRQFNGGLLTTCGLTYSGSPCEIDGIKYGLHGMIGNTPAESINQSEVVSDDTIMLRVSGEVREASVFGTYMVICREVIMDTESNTIYINDVVENRGYDIKPVMNLYHINFGYPLLNNGARTYFSTKKVVPRDETAAKGIDRYNIMEEPEIGREEECFIHTGGTGNNYGMIRNDSIGLAIVVYYNIEQLPIFNEWKCMRAGDYALSLEPSVSGFYGLAYAKEKGLLKYLDPGESCTFNIRIKILDNITEIEQIAKACKESNLK